MITIFPLSVSVCLSEVAPYLRGGGQRQQVVLEGNRLVLTCLVGGSWPLQYRWTFNNSNITDWTQQYRSVVNNWLWIPLNPSQPVSLTDVFSLIPVSILLRIYCVHSCLKHGKQLPVSDGVCLVKVGTSRQWSQSEINNYISTINMYMVWGRKRRSNQ